MKKIIIILIVIFVIYLIILLSCYIAKNDEEKTIAKRKAIPQETRHVALEKLFIYFNDLADRHNIKIIPSYGTLLGLVRDNELIKHDYDIDLFVFNDEWKDFKKILTEELKDNNDYGLKLTDHLWHHKYEIYDKKYNLSADFFRIYEKGNNIKLDVFLSFTKTGIRDGSIVWSDLGRKKYKKDDFLPLKENITKYGKVYYPNKEVNLIEYWYGKDWKTPVEY